MVITPFQWSNSLHPLLVDWNFCSWKKDEFLWLKLMDLLSFGSKQRTWNPAPFTMPSLKNPIQLKNEELRFQWHNNNFISHILIFYHVVKNTYKISLNGSWAKNSNINNFIKTWTQCAWQHLIHHVFKSTNAHFIHSIGRWQNKWRGMHSAAKFPHVFLVFSIYFCYLQTNFGNVWMNKTEKPFCLQGCVRTFSNDNEY